MTRIGPFFFCRMSEEAYFFYFLSFNVFLQIDLGRDYFSEELCTVDVVFPTLLSRNEDVMVDMNLSWLTCTASM